MNKIDKIMDRVPSNLIPIFSEIIAELKRLNEENELLKEKLKTNTFKNK